MEHKVTTVFGQPLDLHYMNNEVRRWRKAKGGIHVQFFHILPKFFLVCFFNIICMFSVSGASLLTATIGNFTY